MMDSTGDDARTVEQEVPHVEELVETAAHGDTPACAASVAGASVAFEVIDGFEVHPAASVMPDMPEEQFTKLVESIAEHGLGEPIEFKDDWLVEGRHRLRAIVKLREQGNVIEVRKAPWQPFPDETVAEYVERKNLHRRHITDDQRLQCAAELQAMADKERAAAGYKAGRIQKGEKRNPKGCNQFTKAPGDGDGSPIPTTPSTPGVAGKSKKMRSSHERLSAKTGESVYKCRQALKVQKHGTPEEIAAVKAGRTTPAEVAKAIDERKVKKTIGKPKAKKPIDHPFTPKTPLQHDLLAGWVKLRDAKVAISERSEARDVMRAILKAEEAEVGSKKLASVQKKGATK